MNATSAGEAVLSVRALTVDYASRRGHVPALRDVDFDLAPGEILGIVGESGSGKSTLASAVQGLLAAPAEVRGGEVLLAGTDMVSASTQKRRSVRRGMLGVVAQNPITALDPTRRIRRAFADVISDSARVRALLESVGFPDPDPVLSSYPHQLSGGMAQRVAIALAVGREPALIIADEPTSALDPDTAQEVLSILTGEARAKNVALLIVTHDLDVVREYCTRVVVMREGRIVEQGAVADVVRNPQAEYTRSLLTATATLHADERAVRVRSGEPVVQLKNATVRFASGAPWARVSKTAVDAVSLDIHRGEMVGLVGPSGSGKTTVSRLLLGLQHPDTGQVLVDGRPLLSPRKGTHGSIQVVLQHPDWALNPSLRVGASIAEPLHVVGGATRAEVAARVSELLGMVGLGADFAQRFPHELSGGQRQRASIARALIARPRLVVFDEAVASLDVSVQAQVLRLIRSMQDDLQFAGLFVSHDPGAVSYISDRVVHMAAGRMIEQHEIR